MATLTPTTHDTLAEALAADLDCSFPRLVRETIDGLYSGIRRLAPSEAEDVVQDAYLRAYRALGRYPAAQIRSLNVRGWLWTIALNVARNRARDATRRPVTVELVSEPGTVESSGSPEQQAVLNSELASWQRRLDRLSVPMRTAVVMRHIAGLTYAEISVALDRPVGTVKADVHRAIKQLRAQLESEEEHHG